MKFNDMNILRNTEVAAPVTETGAGGSGSVVKVQIDWSQAPSISNPESATQIVEYINTLAKDMKPADVLKAVREQFGVSPAIDDTQLKAYIDNSRQIYATLHPESLEQTTDADELIVSDELSTKMSNYAQKYGIEADIDVIIAHIKKAEMEGNVDELGLEIISEIAANNADAVASGNSANSTYKADFVVEPQVLFSPEYAKKSGKEKLNIIMESYLLKTDPEFAKITDASEKAAYIKDKKQELMQLMIKLYPDIAASGKNELSDKELNSILLHSTLLLQVSYKKGISLEELNKLSQQELKDIANKSFSEIVKTILSGIDLNNGEVSSEETISLVIDKMIELNDSSYTNKSEEEKAAIREAKLTQMLVKIGMIGPGTKLSDCDPLLKDNIQKFLVNVMKDLANGDITMDDIISSGTNMKLKFVEFTRDNIKNDQSDQAKNLAKLCDDMELQIVIANSICNENGNVKPENLTHQDYLNWLSDPKNADKLKDYPHLTGENSAYQRLSTYYQSVQESPHAEYLLNQSTTTCSTIRAEAYFRGVEPSELVNIDYDYIMKNGGLDKNFEFIMERFLSEPELMNTLLAKFEAQGVDTKAFRDRYQNLKYDEVTRITSISSGSARNIDAVRRMDARGYLSRDTGDLLVKDYADISKYLDKDEATELSKLSALDSNFADTAYFDAFYGQGIHGYDAKDAAEILQQTINTKGVSDSYTSKMVKTVVETSSEDRQLYYCNELSKTDNKAVIEGLEAASSSVAPSVKAQYEASVSAAAARISENSSTPKTPETVTTGSNPSVSIPVNTENVSPSSNPMPSIAATVKPSTVSTTTVSTTASSSVDTNAVNASTTAALEAKRDNLADNIQEFVQEVEEETSAYQAGLSQDVAEEVAEILEDASQDGTISNEYETRLKELIEQNDISAIYSQIVAVKGSSVMKAFVTALTTYGTHDQVVSFATAYKSDKGLMEELFNHAGTDLKIKLIKAGVIDRSLVLSMIASGAITNFDGIDPDIILQYVREHLSDFKHNLDALKMYLPYIPSEHHQELLTQLNHIRGVVEETTPETEEPEFDGVSEIAGTPVVPLNSVANDSQEIAATTAVNDTPQTEKADRKDDTEFTPTSMNPEQEDGWLTNPIFAEDEPEGTSPDGRMRKDDYTLRYGSYMTADQERLQKGVSKTPEKGSDAWFASIAAQRAKYDDGEASGQYPPTLSNWKINKKKPPQNWS